MLARADVIPQIDQGNRVVVMLLRRLKLRRGALQLLVARMQMDVGAIREFAVCAGSNFQQLHLGLVILMLLHGAQPGLVGLKQLRHLGIAGKSVLVSGFLCHLKKFSWLSHSTIESLSP